MKVVQFKPDTSVKDDIVAMLKKYLARAEQGEFLAVTVVATCADKSSCHATSETDDYVTHTGALQLALHQHLMNSSIVSDP